ncbi:DUF2703 domain-containing protein [Thermosyntropha sp.]|uniref:DUF2703 domain-containing protein n=1 Tax=Thermosyntropha sp. TaxID=2740820 RepID=UPI0025F16E77|nr:DUF2703 domain-containing protein [Thermosyntropha sp.]
MNTDETRKVVIDFLYLDLSVCERCQGTDASLEAALAEVKNILEKDDIEVEVNKINVINEDLAYKYKFVSSPTIRVNGRDIQMEVKESSCTSCGDLCGTDVDCRVWVYKGKEYTEAPKEMIVEAILNEVYGKGKERDLEEKEYVLPENLKRFYRGIQQKRRIDLF